MLNLVIRRLASVIAMVVTAAALSPARAGDDVGGHLDKSLNGLRAGQHESLIRLTEADAGKRRTVYLGLGKSTMIEMPRPARDIIMSNPQAVDAVVQSSNRIFLMAKGFGESNAFIFDENGDQFATLEIYVKRETADLDALLARLIPGSDITAEVLNNTIILTGTVRTPVDSNRAGQIARQFITAQYQFKTASTADGVTLMNQQQTGQGFDNPLESNVINMLAVGGEEQVMLKVTVAEVQRTLLKQFGINIGATINAGNFATSLLTANALPLTTAAGLGSLPIPGIQTTGDNAGLLTNYNPGPVGAGDPFGNSGIAGGWSNGDARVTHAIRALERAGLMRTLAEPTLTAISGEAAKFLAGGEFPIPVADGQGGITVIFKEFGIGVSFTPTVMSEGRISLKIETEVSELSTAGAVTLGGLSIPALTKREAKSTVEMPSGGSLALAGLISDDVRQNIDGLPGLKDLPVLGTLFRSRDFIKEETELVVIVTPYLVQPVARQKLGAPSDGLAEATDLKGIFLGHLNRIYGHDPAAQPVNDLKGDYGFIVE
ncbi:MAG: type II and III secretion system protein family protein [Hyphomicrobium sp.]|jgi:pilus assembly protein CpaC